jgi:hypothetical protein
MQIQCDQQTPATASTLIYTGHGAEYNGQPFTNPGSNKPIYFGVGNGTDASFQPPPLDTTSPMSIRYPGRGYLRVDNATNYAYCGNGTGEDPPELFYVQVGHSCGVAGGARLAPRTGGDRAVDAGHWAFATAPSLPPRCTCRTPTTPKARLCAPGRRPYSRASKLVCTAASPPTTATPTTTSRSAAAPQCPALELCSALRPAGLQPRLNMPPHYDAQVVAKKPPPQQAKSSTARKPPTKLSPRSPPAPKRAATIAGAAATQAARPSTPPPRAKRAAATHPGFSPSPRVARKSPPPRHSRAPPARAPAFSASTASDTIYGMLCDQPTAATATVFTYTVAGGLPGLWGGTAC